ncbi:MAG: OsmC family peroxiredoxin [Calditrichaeota bacterium]|nr:MAG: OsmC family peroxiredoxin [Calditrichota bacterium]
MSDIKIKILGNGFCEATHEEFGEKVKTSISPIFGGKGENFSSTDLVAAALGTCVASSLEGFAKRSDLNFNEFEIMVEKELSDSPKRISALKIEIAYPKKLDDKTLLKIIRIINSCPVRKSLNPEIIVESRFREIKK